MVLLVGLLGACSQSSDTGVKTSVNYDADYAPEDGGTLIDATRGEPSGLIPMIAGESAASEVAQHIFSSLLRFDKNLEFEGQLAESWQVSPDQKIITFKLKPNLKWQMVSL